MSGDHRRFVRPSRGVSEMADQELMTWSHQVVDGFAGQTGRDPHPVADVSEDMEDAGATEASREEALLRLAATGNGPASPQRSAGSSGGAGDTPVPGETAEVVHATSVPVSTATLSTLREVTMLGSAGEPIMFVHLEGDLLFLEFESYAGRADPGGPDIEFLATISTGEFPGICERFDIDPALPILDAIRFLSESGQAPQFVAAVRSGEIETESRLSWWSFDD